MVGRRRVGLAVAALAAAGGLAAGPLAPAASSAASSAAGVAHPPSRPTAVAAAPLGPVTEHPLPADVRLPPAAPGGQSVVQVIQVEVIAGELALETTDAEVTLRRSGDRFVGALGPVRLVDARGSHVGWKVRYRIEAVILDGVVSRRHPSSVSVTPSAPAVVAGLPDGLAPGRPADPAAGRRLLFSARPGTGGGTYTGGATVSIPADDLATVDEVAVVFSFDVQA